MDCERWCGVEKGQEKMHVWCLAAHHHDTAELASIAPRHRPQAPTQLTSHVNTKLPLHTAVTRAHLHPRVRAVHVGAARAHRSVLVNGPA